MNKKQIKLLGVLGCLALVGSASAAWSFNKNSQSAKTIGLQVEGYATVGSVSIVDNEKAAYLDLDDNSVLLKEADDVVATYTASSNQGGKTETLTWTIELSTNLAKYIAVDGVSSGTWTSGSAIKFPDFKYVSGKNPTTLAEYQEMKSVLGSGNEYITLTCKAEIA